MAKWARAGGKVVVALAAMLVMLTASETSAEGIAKRLTCTFDSGTSTIYQAGEFISKPAQALTFEIANIDLEAQSARLLTSEGDGAGTLRVVRALNANHFIEVVNEGFLNLTTIYELDLRAVPIQLCIRAIWAFWASPCSPNIAASVKRCPEGMCQRSR